VGVGWGVSVGKEVAVWVGVSVGRGGSGVAAEFWQPAEKIKAAMMNASILFQIIRLPPLLYDFSGVNLISILSENPNNLEKL